MGVRTAARRLFPRGVDVRLLIGATLVIASLAGVWLVVASADRTVAVYAAADTLVVGDPVGPQDVVERRVSLGDAEALYLAPGGLPEGSVATRTVAAGELVPIDAVGRSGDVARAPVVVPVAGELPEGVVDGGRVDVWSVPATEGDAAGPPSVLISGAVVSRVVEEDGLVSRSGTASVELSVPDGSVAVVLAATAAGDSLALVPVSASER